MKDTWVRPKGPWKKIGLIGVVIGRVTAISRLNVII